MKHKKLDMRGFSHEMLLVAFVVIFGIAGVGYVVASHANQLPSGGAPIAVSSPVSLSANSKVAPNPAKCPTPFQDTSALAHGSRGPLYDYFANAYVSKNSDNGKLLKDHLETLRRQDAVLAKVGYCYHPIDIEGYAYGARDTVTQAGIKAAVLYQYTNRDHHHFYTIDKQNVPEGYKRTIAVAKVASQAATGLVPVFEYFNPGLGGHYFFTSNTDVTAQAYFKSIGYVLNPTTPVFYLWANADGPQPQLANSTHQPAAQSNIKTDKLQ